MSFNALELRRVGDAITGDAGVATVNFTTNPGPNSRIYLYAEVGHTDNTDRLTGLFLDTITSAGLIAVAAPRTISDSASDKVFITRPILVAPGERLQGQCAAITTADNMTARGAYIEIPEGQTIEDIF